ncbi:MAG: hypothetical protein HY815_07380 [Candidatus Riflebacteria bacterium]|nr:hypothetical protein [Candidatus Riflebacteria bacterium]
MIVLGRDDLEILTERLRLRLGLGAFPVLAVLSALLANPLIPLPATEIWVAGLLLGSAGAVRGWRRLHSELFACRTFEDFCLLWTPWLLAGALFAGRPPPLACSVAWVVVIARGILVLQETAMLHRANVAATLAEMRQLEAFCAVAGPAPRPLPPVPPPSLPAPVPGLSLQTVEPGSSPRCPICSEPLGEPIARCARCDAPHHLECFDYNGCCGRFGCGGTPLRG